MQYKFHSRENLPLSEFVSDSNIGTNTSERNDNNRWSELYLGVIYQLHFIHKYPFGLTEYVFNCRVNQWEYARCALSLSGIPISRRTD